MLISGKQIIFTYIIITEEIFRLCCRYKVQLKIALPFTTLRSEDIPGNDN